MGLSSSLLNVFIPLTFPYGFDRARLQYATDIVDARVREVEQQQSPLFLTITFLRLAYPCS